MGSWWLIWKVGPVRWCRERKTLLKSCNQLQGEAGNAVLVAVSHAFACCWACGWAVEEKSVVVGNCIIG